MRAPTVRPRGTRLALALATLVWLLAWGRLGAVGLTQPPRWRDDLAAQGFDCRLNAFDRDGLVYRSCDREEGGNYLVAFNPVRRAIAAQWRLPADFYAARWFDAVAVDPAGGLTLLGNRGVVARLRDGGGVGGRAPPPAPPSTKASAGRPGGWEPSLPGSIRRAAPCNSRPTRRARGGRRRPRCRPPPAATTRPAPRSSPPRRRGAG